MFSFVPYGCFSVAVLFCFIFLFPLFFADVMLLALSKLGLSKEISIIAIFAIFIGSLINIPVKRIPRKEILEALPLGMFGFSRIFPRFVQRRSYTIIALNVGGCIIPVLIATYEFIRISSDGLWALIAMILAVMINISVCYGLARPVQGVGIVLHAFIPGLVAAVCALIFYPQFAPMIAFNAGVLGPLLGADLLNLRKISQISTGLASIGGAGTFDGIVISGLVATLLV